jgi:hypothetical protein
METPPTLVRKLTWPNAYVRVSASSAAILELQDLQVAAMIGTGTAGTTGRTARQSSARMDTRRGGRTVSSTGRMARRSSGRTAPRSGGRTAGG